MSILNFELLPRMAERNCVEFQPTHCNPFDFEEDEKSKVLKEQTYLRLRFTSTDTWDVSKAVQEALQLPQLTHLELVMLNEALEDLKTRVLSTQG